MMDLYRVSFGSGGKLGVTLWGVALDDLEPFIDQLEDRFPICLVEDEPVPPYLWTEADRQEWLKLQTQPMLWEEFNWARLQARLQAWLKPPAVAGT